MTPQGETATRRRPYRASPAEPPPSGWKGRLLHISATLLTVSSALAVLSLALEHGFSVPPWMRIGIHAALIAVVACFMAYQAIRLVVARQKAAYLREHVVDLTVLCLFLVLLPVMGSAFLTYVEGYVIVVLLLQAARLNARLMAFSVRPAFVIVGSFAAVILAGSVVLLLPRASADPARPLSVVDSIFTSTSAACVTGLTVRPIESDFSELGRLTVLVLIQVGGLGLVTYTIFFALLQQRSLSVRHSVIVREVFSLEVIGGIGRLLAVVIGATLLFEAAGAVALGLMSPEGPGRWEWAIFHSVSAFCNAGFCRWPDVVPMESGVLLVVLALTIVGGLGFPVMQNLLSVAARRRPSRRDLFRGEAEPPARATVHTKIVLGVSALLLLLGALFYLAAEGPRESLRGQPFGMKVLVSFFQSGVARTSGFTAIPQEGTLESTQIATIALMSVGASPASTGGGMKTVTMAILVATLFAMIRNREEVEIFGRSVPRLFVNAAISIVVLYGAAVFVCSFTLSLLEPGIPFRKLLFETVSALSTVGLTTGATAEAGPAARLVLCAAMFVGRVGPLAVLMSIAGRAPSANYRYPNEGVIVA